MTISTLLKQALWASREEVWASWLVRMMPLACAVSKGELSLCVCVWE